MSLLYRRERHEVKGRSGAETKSERAGTWIQEVSFVASWIRVGVRESSYGSRTLIGEKTEFSMYLQDIRISYS